MLVGNRKPKLACELARLRLAAVAERKAQHFELLARGAEQEITLIALLLARPIERAAARRQASRRDIVAGRQRLGAQLASGAEQIMKLDRHVAVGAKNRPPPAG